MNTSTVFLDIFPQLFYDTTLVDVCYSSYAATKMG